MHRVSLLRSFLSFALLDAAFGIVSCGQCTVIQEAIQRAIIENITAYEKQAHAGTQTTARIEIGHLIWRVCDGAPWKAQRYHSELQAACSYFVKQHVDHATNFWKDKTVDEYKDPVRRRRTLSSMQ